jgi:N-acyl-L-homoserine lactone synthetase
MKGSSPVLRRLIAVSAAVLGVGLVATGCSAVKMGAAAIVGNQRITLATLDTEVTNLSQNVQQYHNPSSLTAAAQTQDQRAAGPRRGHHGLGRSGADGARAG